jgi:non-specific serine/threonine protein kinase
MPLAIELAAARVKALSVEQIAERLRDRFQLLTRGSRTALPRHQTLRATIDWSYDLLSEHERILLRRLAVFAGGWTLEAAEGVCGDESMDPADVLDRLTGLVDKSLVIMEVLNGETRYRLLETVRQYAREKLLDSGEATRIRDRHRDSYLELAERAEPMLIGPEQGAWMERLEVEHSNLRVALEWSKTGDGGAEALVRLAAALWRFWNVRGYGSEGRGWLEAALSQAGQAPRAARARLLFGAGVLAWFQQESGRAATLGEESLALARELGDKRAVADSLRLLAAVAWYDYERAKALGEESLALFRELGDKLGISAVLRFLGVHAMTYDEFEAAIAPFEESLRLARALKDKRGIAWSLHGLGGVPFQQARYEEAVALHEEALSLFRDLGDKWGMSSALGSLGAIARYRGDYERAVTLLEESLQVRQEMGSKAMIPLPLLRLGLLAQDQGDYRRAKSFYEESLALYREVGPPAPGPAGERWGVADTLRALGIATWHEGDYVRAAALLEESIEISREVRNKSSLADALDSLGTVASCQGKDKRAGALKREALI